MRFLSDILAKAGLIVDGAVVFNSTANGQTPASNDDSTKLATTAWVRSFTQPYTLPIASATILGGVKVGTGLAIDPVSGVLSLSGGGVSIKSTETFTATQGQSIFTIANGYTVGLIDVFLNGVYLSPGQITATNGTTITLNDPAIVGDIIDVIVTSPLSEGSLATTDQLPEGVTNLYYTNTRARAAISLTTTGVSGAATYNILTGQLNIPNYQGLVPAGGIAGQILAKASSTSYDTTWIDNYTSQVQHTVKAGVAVTKGQAVYVSSADGTNMIVSKASNASEGTASKTLGLVAQDLAINGQGFVITEGLLAGLDTSTANAGDPVWLGTNGNLIYGLLNKPTAPAHLVFIGIVTRVQQNNGEIFVKVQNGFELDELHDLSVKNASDGDMIKYVASTGLWTKIAATTTNISEGTNLYYTDVRVGSYLTANSYATQSYVATQIANLVASAPATLDTLNELATALGNDPNFATTVTTSIGTKVPQARTITINGTAYDLSADRSWTIAAGLTSFNTRTGAITLTSADVTGALGYTPYNSTNPSGYITSSGSIPWANLTSSTVTGWMTTGRNGTSTQFYLAHSSGYGMHINTYNQTGSIYALELYNNVKALFTVYNDGRVHADGGNQILHAANYGSYALPLTGGVMTGSLVNNTDGAVVMESNGSENNNWLWKEASKSWGLFWFNRGTQSGQTIGGYTTVGAELMFMGGNTGIAMPTGWTGYQSGSYVAAMISNYTGYIYSASTVYAATSMVVGGNTVLHAGNYTSYTDPRYVRRDTTNQFLKPYWEYGNYLGNDAPSTLASQMSGGGMRVDFMGSSGSADGSWSHVITFSGYNRYSMSQIGTNYNTTNAKLYYRQTNNHDDVWASWKEFVFTNTAPTFSNVYAGAFYMSNSTSKYITNNGSTYGSLYIGGVQGGYSGFRFDGDMQLMMHTNGAAGPCGFWLGNWSILTYVNASQYLYHNGSQKFQTQSDGVRIEGTLYATGDVIAYYSDIRLKKDITLIDSPITKIQQLRGVTYTWNDEEVNKIKDRAGTRDIGLIAQEVEAVEPLLITEYQTQLNTPSNDPDEADKFVPKMSETYKTIKYEKLVALLIEGVKEQQTQIETQQSEIAELKDLVKQLLAK